MAALSTEVRPHPNCKPIIFKTVPESNCFLSHLPFLPHLSYHHPSPWNCNSLLLISLFLPYDSGQFIFYIAAIVVLLKQKSHPSFVQHPAMAHHSIHNKSPQSVWPPWLLLLLTEVAQSCRTFCNPMDCSPPGSSIHGIFQGRVLEWVAISFSRESSWPKDQTRVSIIVGRCFTVWATREDLVSKTFYLLLSPHSDYPQLGLGQTLASGPFHWLFCLSRLLFIQIFTRLAPSNVYFSPCSKYHHHPESSPYPSYWKAVTLSSPSCRRIYCLILLFIISLFILERLSILAP